MGACGDQVPRHASEYPFTEPAVSIGAGDQPIGFPIPSDLDQLLRAGLLLYQHDLGAGLDDVMTAQVASHVTEVEPSPRALPPAGRRAPA